MFVHLCNHHACRFACGRHIIARRPEAAKALRIGRRNLHHRHVDRQQTAAEEVRHLEEETRHVVRPIRGHRLTRSRTDKGGAMPKMPLHTCRHIADCTRAQHVKNLNISILLTTFQELFRHDLRNPCALREDHPIAVTYHLHGLFNRHRPCGKNLFSIHTRIFQWLLCLCFVINKSWDKIELPEGIRTLYVTLYHGRARRSIHPEASR